jgi:putative copper export protein
MPPYVTYALLALCIGLFFFGLWLEGKNREGTRFERFRRYAWIAQLAAVVAAYAVLRPGRGTADPEGAVRVAKNDRTPVFLDFYSNY